jgi:uncharacterized protein YbaP (TraB family)
MKALRALLLAYFAFAALSAQAQLFLWKAERDGHAAWLLGSVHMARADFYPLPKPIEDAYAGANTLVVEADVTDKAAMMPLLGTAMLPAPQSIHGMLSSKQNRQLNKVLQQLGLSADVADHMKPWFLAMTLEAMEMQHLGFAGDEGIDLHFLNHAKDAGKQVVELESVKAQFALFDTLSPEEAVAMLNTTVSEVAGGHMKKEIQAMMVAWKQGDARAMRRLLEEEAGDDLDMKHLNDKLFGERNRAMLEKIDSLAGTPAPFIVVGAGHLAGPDNLIDMLRARGYQLTQY